MIRLTESAANAVRSAIENSTLPVEGLRVMVESGGCAGNKYLMGLVAEATPGDILVEQGDIKLYVEPESADLLSGTTVDFVIGMEGSGFTFDNPGATKSCSCGKSFG